MKSEVDSAACLLCHDVIRVTPVQEVTYTGSTNSKGVNVQQRGACHPRDFTTSPQLRYKLSCL